MASPISHSVRAMGSYLFKFKFQYDPSDLAAIRQFNGVAQSNSPARMLTRWSVGLAASLILLGLLGAWNLIGLMVVIVILFSIFYLRQLNQFNVSHRETMVRTLKLDHEKVSEEQGDSLFEKSWAAFEQWHETEHHFLLRHYEKITAIPKRVMPPEQIAPCRDLVSTHVGRPAESELELFRTWFRDSPAMVVSRFKWTDSDMEELARARLQIFDPQRGLQPGRPDSQAIPWFGTALIVLVALAVAVYLAGTVMPGDLTEMVRLLLVPLAIATPFLLIYVWWRLFRSSAKRIPRIPREEIFLAVNQTALLIGYPQAVARYSWKDINSFYYSQQFIGFRPHQGMIHVIANHAFGGPAAAWAFLHEAYQFKSATDHDGKPTQAEFVANPNETDNPYQPPGS